MNTKKRKIRRGLWWSENTQTYHFQIRIDGELHADDTGNPIEAEARVWLAAYRKQVHDAKVGIAPAEAGPAQDAPTLQEALEQWEAEANRAGVRHRENVRSSILLHFKPELKLPLPALTKPVVDRAVARYLAGTFRGRPRSEGGANVVLRALKCVVLHALRAKRITEVPFEGVAMLDPQPRPHHAPTAEDLDLLLKTLDQLKAPQQARDLVILIAGLGLRVTESCTARVEAFNARRKIFTPWDPLVGTKGHTAVELPVVSWVLPHLVRLAGDRKEGYLVQGKRGERTSRALLGRWLTKARAKMHWPWLTPHELRACYATLLAEEGVNPKLIQELMRHKQFKTTERYIRFDKKQAREALERIGEKAGLTSKPAPKAPAKTVEQSTHSRPKFKVVRIKSTITA